MRFNRNYRTAGRLAVALAVAAGTAWMWQGYGPAASGTWTPPSGARCEAPAAGADIVGQIRYDSGLVLRYCSVPAMLAQLGALEQPGLVRAAAVRTADGRWLPACTGHDCAVAL
ncbi:hypothetical protein Jab_2c10760 [Janthinobacterium sp. HH01]|uniref:hypothetical protein n=1 Tax=Janthinobacterium sp. HH01 TaxID=1198452 RepID=UPI0002AE9384|nr:hypothetical protein [Janthinobacterium sp. HH01]ELX09017.1 hypothetical protein Jab_2c10760 [Janthinobacterium sp. HH01]